MAEYNSSYTGAQIDSAVAKAHSHTGNITESGTLQTTDVTIADGDKLVVTDASDGNKVARASVSFNGTTTTKALTQKGTFETFARPSDLPTTMVASGTGHAGGLVPDPPETAGTLKYLREDGTWAEPDGGADGAFLKNATGSAATASFDPQTDTVWTKAQTLSSAQKSQVKENLGLESLAYLDTTQETAYAAGFDPTTDTVWNKEQTLTATQKAQVKANLGIVDFIDTSTHIADIDSTIISQALRKTEQSLTTAEKAQVLVNLGLESKVAASDGTSTSLVTTGEKYTWNNKQDALTFNTTPSSDNKVATMADIPGAATTSAAGLMSAADKTKLDGLNITISSSDPTSSDGQDGDIWLVYDAS